MKYPWFEIAERELGVEEVPGAGDNPRIVEYLQSTTLGFPENENDETPWCSAFVNWCMEQAGVEGTGSAWARSWLDWGREPEPGEYKGCVCILERGKNAGHVGFLDSWEGEESVTLLGGNQHDKVCYVTFPFDRVLGFRIPV